MTPNDPLPPNVGPLDRYVIGDGATCWFTGETCDCGEAMATDGARTWCEGGCAGVKETL